jgi:hypothetical protein
MDAKLFYPLYSVDDKNLNWPSHEFFDHFYGGPYQPSQYESNQEHSATSLFFVPKTKEKDIVTVTLGQI